MGKYINIGNTDFASVRKDEYVDKPAIVIELKYNHSAEGAIRQIKEKQYIDALRGDKGILCLLVLTTIRKRKSMSVR